MAWHQSNGEATELCRVTVSAGTSAITTTPANHSFDNNIIVTLMTLKTLRDVHNENWLYKWVNVEVATTALGMYINPQACSVWCGEFGLG
jgi:hypothetical protein